MDNDECSPALLDLIRQLEKSENALIKTASKLTFANLKLIDANRDAENGWKYAEMSDADWAYAYKSYKIDLAKHEERIKNERTS